MTQCLESVTKMFIGEFTIRFWREEQPGEPIDNRDITHNATLKGMNDMQLIADYIAQQSRVSAVEVLNSNNGIVLYNDWP